MLNVKVVKLINAKEVFEAIQNKFNKNARLMKADFAYIYSDDGIVPFTLPSSKKACEEVFEECEQYVVDILMNEGGLKWGEKCYLDFYNCY